MENIKDIAFDQMLLALIKEAYKGEPLRGGYIGMTNAMQRKDIECTQDQVKESITRLVKNDLMTHKWNGSHFETVPIIEVPKKEEKSKEPILATPVVYRFYELFKDFYHDGNFVKMDPLSDILKVSARKVRKMKRLFNTRGYSLKNGNTFKRKILGNNQGYTLISNEKQKREARRIIVNKLLECVDELTIFDEDMNVDDQLTIDMRTMKSKITKSISNDLIE